MKRHQQTTLRILFCTWDYFPAPAGGAERQARLQAEELGMRGHEVEVVCPRTPGFASGVVDGIKVHRLPCIKRPRVGVLTYLPFLTLFLLRRMRSFDVVHVHIASLQADAIVVLGALLRRPVYVKVACGGSAGEVTRMRGAARVTRYVGLRAAARVQALSSEISGELATIGVSRDRVVEIPNGVDLRSFGPASPARREQLRRQLDLPIDDVLLLFTGRFARYKGIDDVLAVNAEHSRPGVTLVLVGSAETDRPMAPIEPRPGLIVRGWTNRIIDFLQAADIFVVPSYADGMSNSLLEAMSCGLAVVATRVGAAPAMVEDGVSGLLVEPGDRAALGAALDRLVSDRGLREEFGRAAALRATAFDVTRVVDLIEGEYRQIATPSLGQDPPVRRRRTVKI